MNSLARLGFGVGVCFAVVLTRAEVYTVVTNPAEDCSTGMNVGWQADLDETDCAVLLTAKSDADWAHATKVRGKSEKCEAFDGISSKTADGKDWKEEAKFLDYGVTLTGLKPDTDYMYRVLGKNGAKSASGVHYFKTAGAKEFDFLWFSDVHAYTPIPNRVKNLNSVIEAAIKIEPGVDFVFSTGDVVAWGGSYSFWKYLFEQPFAKNYMFADTIGNHDWMKRTDGGSSDFFRIAHNNPTNGYAGQEGVCYSFAYGDVLFLTFNNELIKKGPENLAAAQTWAAGVIEKMKGKYKRIFIAEHYQWLDGRKGQSSWYEKWKDFCDKHHVTLALSGNNHVYERTHPLFADKVVEDGKGTVYMATPSSDGERGVEAGKLTENADKLAFTYSSHVHSNEKEVKTIGCVLVKVTPTSIATKLVYIHEEGEVHVDDEHVTHLEDGPAR